MSKIIGIGNALVDVIVKIHDESLLQSFSLSKGGMKMIDIAKKRELHSQIQGMQQILASGGSTSNTIHGLAHLGLETGYIGKVCKDAMGRFFENDMKRSHIQPHLAYSDIDTGIATTLMTADAERTFATYLGAASTLTPADIDDSIFSNYDYIHVEGYLIFNRDLILHVCRKAKEHQMTISMDMASYNLVKDNHDLVSVLLKDYVDIIFANDEEAEAFTGKRGQEALDIFSQYCPISIVKMGIKGSIANVNGEQAFYRTNDQKPVDTNGAGDIYAAGFLYGLINHYPVQKIGQLATRLADELILTVGAKLSDEQWNNILADKTLFC